MIFSEETYKRIEKDSHVRALIAILCWLFLVVTS